MIQIHKKQLKKLITKKRTRTKNNCIRKRKKRTRRKNKYYRKK